MKKLFSILGIAAICLIGAAPVADACYQCDKVGENGNNGSMAA